MKTFFKKHRTILVLASLIIVFNGCMKNDDFDMNNLAKNEWSPDLAVPLINSHLSLNDIISVNQSGLFTVNNHQVCMVYKTNLYKISGYEFFTPVSEATAQTLQILPMDSTTLYQTGTVSRSISQVFPLTFPNGEQIDSMTFRQGGLRINIQSDIPHDGILNIKIPSATINGQSFDKDVPFSASLNSTIFTQDIFDMSGYHMTTTNAGMSNMLNISYTLTFNDSSIHLPTLNKNFNIAMTFDSIRPASLFGYFGQREFMIPSDSTQIDVFNNFQSGSVFFDNPKMTISLSNSFGMPIDANIASMFAIPATGAPIPLTGPIPSPLIDYPLSLGQTVTNSFYFDKSNSNIQTIVNSTPKFVVYNITAGTNSPLPTYNFMSDSSQFRADMEIDFPMKGYVAGFTIQDTVDFSLSNMDMISSADFRFNISNGFPIHAMTQLYFADQNYNILDSMLTNSQNRIMEAAETDADGKVTAPTVRSADELFDGTRLQHLFNTKKILIKAVIETSDAPSTMIQVFDYYKLDFKIGVRTKLKINY